MSEKQCLPELSIGILRIFQRQGQPPLIVMNVSANGIIRRIGIAHGSVYDVSKAQEIDDEAWDRLVWGETHFHF